MTTPETTPTPASQEPRRYDKRKVWAILCVTVPTALWIVTIALAAVINIVFNDVIGNEGRLESMYPLHVALNIFAFLLGTIAFLTWLPGIITGIVLLATRK